MLTRHHHSRSSADRGSGLDPSFMTDVKVWTAWCLGCHTCPDVRSSCPWLHHNKLKKRTITVIPLPPRPADDGPASDGPAVDDPVSDGPADDGPAYDGSAGDGSSRVFSFGWPSRCDGSDGLCTTQQLLLTQHSIRTQQVPTQHTHGFQSSAVAPWGLVEELRFPASGPFHREDGTVQGFACSGSRAKVLQNTVKTIRQADRMAGSSVMFAQRHRDSKSSTKVMSSKKTTSRTSVFNRLGSPTATTTQRTVTQEPPFRAGAGRGARHRPYSDSRKKSGKFSAACSTRQRWRVPGGGSPSRLCPALAESAGQLPGHRHCRGWGGQCIPATTSAHPSVHQLPDQKQPSGPPASRLCLAAEGSHRAGHQRDFPRVLQLVVPGPKEDRRSAACNRSLLSQPPHGSSSFQDGDARVRLFSHQKSGVDDIYRHPRCLPSCSDAPGRLQVSMLRCQQAGVPVHWSPLWVSDFSTRVHQAAAAHRSAVKAARCEATHLLRRLADQSRYSGTGQTARPDDHQCAPVSRLDHQQREVRPCSKSGLFQFNGMQFNTRQFTVAPLPKMRRNVQSVHQHWITDPNITARDMHRLLGMLVGVHGFAGPVVGRHSMVPEDRELVRPDPSSSVGSVRGGLVGISSSPASSTPGRQGDGSDCLHGCIQFGLGSPVRLTLDTGTVVSISMIVAHQCSGDAGRHQRRKRLPASSEVRVVRLMCDNAVTVAHIKNEGGTRSHTLMQLTIRLLKWCDHKAITLVPVHLPGVHNIQADSLSRVGQTLTTEWTMAMERLRPVFAKWGEPQVDLFATIANRRLIKFVSAYPDPRAEWTDAMSMPWDNGMGLLYAFPPFKMVPQVLQKIAQSPGVRVILIAQLQPAASWFRSWWICPKKIRSRCTSKVKTWWLKTFGQRQGDRDSSLPAVKSTCVETLRAILRAKGHSREAANMMSRCLRESSLQVYESHWSRFVAFCRTKRWLVFWVRSHHFSTYMMHLFRDGLLPSPIISHLTSVASVLRPWVYDPAADPHFKLLVRAFRLECPVQRRIMPKWDLHLVLLSLLRPPFASDVIPLKWRTMKCVFLLALASARQRSYLHALSIAPGRCVFARGNTQWQLVVSLLPEPCFLTKNQLPTQAPEWITVPRIVHLNLTEPVRTLCPVRQLKLYIWDSERIRGRRQRMFIHWNHNIRDIMRSHISRWIVETVKEAYAQADREYDRVKAHEVRAL